MTKKELEEKNKALRAELDKAHAQLKEFETVKSLQGKLDERAVGGYYDEEKKLWILSELHFNKETGQAEVFNQKSVGGDIALFSQAVKEFIVREISLRSMK